MSEFVQNMADAMNNAMGATLAVFLLAMIPIAEARFAIPFGMSMGLKPSEAFGWAFLGSSLLAPILLLTLIPIINALSKTKFFSKVGKFLYDKFDKKSAALKNDERQSPEGKKPHISKQDIKKMGGVCAFVAVPLPLTGVWTGSAVASICKTGFLKGLIGVIVGNAVACGIITLISFLFAPYVNYITIAFLIIALAVVLFLIVKFIIYKPKAQTQSDTTDTDKIDASVGASLDETGKDKE